MALDRIITIYEPTSSKSASGMETVTYQQVSSSPVTYAELTWENSGTGESDEGKQRVSTTVVRMKLRYRSDLNQKNVILCEGIYYDNIKNKTQERRRWLMVEWEQKDNEITLAT